MSKYAFLLFGLLVLCGAAPSIDDKEEKGRIVNGQEAPDGALPYQASIQLNYGSRLVAASQLTSGVELLSIKTGFLQPHIV